MPSCDVRAELRAATAGAHARVDALVGDWQAAEAYAAYLGGMAQFLCRCRDVLGGTRELDALQAAIAADLADLDVACGVEVPDAPPERGDADARLGWEYVLAGASLGARVLLARARALGHDGTHGARFLTLHAGSGMWAGFLARIAAAPVAEARLARIRAGACAAFGAAEDAFLQARHAVAA
ncbi:MAG TPA: hypothetical protein VEY50_05560 [Lysobacter sp.]|nr:hypothetical protein [Lysobacter sp.]